MSGVQGAMIGHVVRRGLEHFHGATDLDRLQQDAQLYENAGPEMQVKPQELLPVFITAVIALFLIASIRYTVGEVMASLAMIESPSSTAIIDSKPPPAYSDIEPDALIAKEPLEMEEIDLEVTVIDHKPITAKVTTTIGHLHRVGGFFARWRGLGFSVLYHFIHALVTNSLASLVGFGLVGYALVYIVVSVGTARLHMLWTHSMIAYPSNKSWFRRVVPRKKNALALLLPSLVYAAAQQATFLLPLAVAFTLKLQDVHHEDVINAAHHKNCAKMMFMGLRFLAVPATGLLVAFAVLLPAAVTLTRIEAALLPEDEETIVPFDRAAVMGDVDLTARGGCRTVFVQAWRSFDRAARWRLIKVYVKMVLAQAAIALIAVHLAIAELFIIGGDRLGLLFKSAAAQLKVMAAEAKNQA
jgi:hypothetical protein